MVVLVTNDDGYMAPGLFTLYKTARKVFGNNVVFAAPDGPRSSSGMSFTFHKPLRVEKIKHEGISGFTVSGTPADCVFIAVHHMFKGKIDLVLSGINEGMNVGLETVYSSGTISAAMFAAISNIPSIAFSKHTYSDDHDDIKYEMESTKQKLFQILNIIKKKGFPTKVDMLNVNFPKKVNMKTRIMVVKTDRRVFDDIVREKKDPRGRLYYWLYGTLRKDLDKKADIWSLMNGHITITPIQLSVIEPERLSEAEKLFTKNDLD
ncbi:5'/3'-nucleotidase SurE [Candidatus Parvarchaeota archaeon]|nr:5'/3'-nucleotidase SurE [Candidatus Parvarchaeota archaeon]